MIGVLCWEVRLEGISYIPVFVVLRIFYYLFCHYLYVFVAKGLVPIVQLIKIFTQNRILLDECISKSIKNENIFPKQCVRSIRDLISVYFSIPFFQVVNKISKFFILMVQPMPAKLLELKTRIMPSFEQLLNVFFGFCFIICGHNVLKRSAHNSSIRIIIFQEKVQIQHYKDWFLSNQKSRKNLVNLLIIKLLLIQSMEKQIMNQRAQFFLFVNSSSGGGIGSELLQQGGELHFQVPASQYPVDKYNRISVTLYLFNLKCSQNRMKGFEQLKVAVNQDKRVFLVICGGDGTVMWVVSQLNNFLIQHDKVPITIIPLGTGNDFSQNYGWGKSCPSDLLHNNYEKLKKRISYWLSAKEEKLDIWMVDAYVQDYGKFEKVQNNENKLLEGRSFRKHFCNYFSLGIDAKVGYSFDMHRTTTRVGNIAMYGLLGLVKSFSNTKTIGDLTCSLVENKASENNIFSMDIAINNQIISTKPQQKKILSKETPLFDAIQDNSNLLFLNINSFMGGVKDIWKKSSTPAILQQLLFAPQSQSDGKIQILTFGGVMSLGLQKSIGGFATKMHQGGDPIQMAFNQFPKEQKHRTYLQIDGQFFRYTHPKYLVVRKSTLSSTGKIRVLRREVTEMKQKFCC